MLRLMAPVGIISGTERNAGTHCDWPERNPNPNPNPMPNLTLALTLTPTYPNTNPKNNRNLCGRVPEIDHSAVFPGLFFINI